MTNELRVLLVDDNEDLGAMMVEYLHAVGHRATAASTAEQALELLEAQDFDVIVTDVSLPGMSGIALAKSVASRWPHVGIVISSGYGDLLARDYFPAELEPVVMLMAKPCELKDLPATLAAALARRKAAPH